MLLLGIWWLQTILPWASPRVDKIYSPSSVSYTHLDVYKRQAYDLKKAKEREHILEGLKLVADHTDEVISIIRHSEDNRNSSTPGALDNFLRNYNVPEFMANVS